MAVFREKYEVVAAIFHGFDRSKFFTGAPTERVSVLPAALEHVLAQDEGRERLVASVGSLSKAFALAVPHEDVLALTDEVAFFQAVRAALPKGGAEGRRGPDEIEHAVRQIVAGATVSDEVIDVFAAAGLPKPDISILSDEFLAEVRGLPQRNLAVELLRKLLTDEIKTRSRRNLVEARAFSEMLEKSLRAYQNRAIETAAVLVSTVRRNTTIDWAEKESVRAKLRLMVKRILRRYGYPPDKQEKATRTVLEQAEVLSTVWGVEPPPEPTALEDQIDYPMREEVRPDLRAVAEKSVHRPWEE